MNIADILIWQPVEWPVAGTEAVEYAIFVNGAPTASYTTSGSVTSTAVTYDDASATGYVFSIRPWDGFLTYGPEQTIVISRTPLNNTAWVRSFVRKAVSDRLDISSGSATVVQPKITDDELNEYIAEALRAYSNAFPKKGATTLALDPTSRDYPLPDDFLYVISAKYISFNGLYTLWLTEEPYKGGETTVYSWAGYPKLGILQSPLNGRYFPGHFSFYNLTLSTDFDAMAGDTITLEYAAKYPMPTDSYTKLTVPTEHMELITLFVQGKFWLQLESKDVSLSRWDRGQTGGARRDDMPTEKMSTRMFNAWQQKITEIRTLRPRQLRLVRRA